MSKTDILDLAEIIIAGDIVINEFYKKYSKFSSADKVKLIKAIQELKDSKGKVRARK
jgi:hypothetical protein